MDFPEEVTFKMFCSWPTPSGQNCGNEAVGEMGFHLWNNPRPDADVMYLPVCQEHRDKALDKQRKV